MEYDWRFSQKSKCSDEEKRECLKLVSELIALSKVARRNGLLSLVTDAEKNSSFLLRKGLQLVVDGVNPQVTREVLESYILSGDYNGKELLKRFILEGVAAIQKGFHPKVTKEFLLSFLGEESYAIFEEEFEDQNKDTIEMYLQKLEDSGASPTTESRLDAIILKLNNDEIEKFLMEINTGDLAKTIKSLGGQAQIRLFNNLSQNAAKAIKDVLDDLDSLEESEMKEAQDIALDILSDLDQNA
jgi:flagellar motor switch protein FliG